MTPPLRLEALASAIAACALDAMLGEADVARGAPEPVADAVPTSYDEVALEQRTWAYRQR